MAAPTARRGISNASSAMRTPASRAARCGDTGGSKRYRSGKSRSSGTPAQARTDSRSVPSTAPVCTGFQYMASSAATRSAERTVFPTFVSVPVTKEPFIGEQKRNVRVSFGCATSIMAPTSSASMSRESFAVSDNRSRAEPGGTVGGRIARTPNPRARRCAAKSSAVSLDPRITGTMWESLPRCRSRFAAIHF